MLPNIGPLELAIVLIVALLILGPKKLPQVGRSMGEGMREFKDSITGAGERPEPAPAVRAATSDSADGERATHRA